MNKKVVLAAVIGSFLFLGACKKKEEAKTETQNSSISSSASIGIPEQEKRVVPANGKYPVMTFEKKEHDFGIIKADSKVDYTFKFKNTGKEDLVISNAQGSCGCTIPEYPKEAIKPGESGKIKVSFNSAGKSGNQQKSVTITANTEVEKELLTIKAQIK